MSKSSRDTKPDLFRDSSMLYGGPGGSRTRVQNAFTLKGLQQFFNYLPRARLVARRAACLTGLPLR